jgi:hypothetical protein
MPAYGSIEGTASFPVSIQTARFAAAERSSGSHVTARLLNYTHMPSDFYDSPSYRIALQSDRA